ncbi:MAG: DNA replication/repair protein RecF [Proteobacteria bacterium]|nr:DNA replication/repair protein RecF [Pseudomonadota bacterium]
MVSRLAITRLSLSDYRCYPRLKLETDARPVVLTGPNGAGKTNLLEAMSYLAPGRGLRGARLSEIDRHGGGGAWAVAAKIQTPEGAFDIGAGRCGNDGTGDDGEGDGAAAPASDAGLRHALPSVQLREAGEAALASAKPPAEPGSAAQAGRRRDRRIVRINGLAAPGPAALGEIVSLLWLTPSMDRLFSDGAGARRRFLDRLVFGVDPGHAGRLAAYERAMRSRARLLRTGAGDRAWLTALEQSMAERGVAITVARREAAAAITRASADGTGPFPAAGLRLEGAPLEDWLDAGPALAAEERFTEALVASRASDAETGGAAIGPHRSDLTVSAAATGVPAKICSTGEQKALLISIVLAGTRMQAAIRGAVPLLLLDEVTAHLDEGHRHALFEEISFLGVQAWLTGTDRSLFAPLGDRAQYFDVVDAHVSPAGAPQ